MIQAPQAQYLQQQVPVQQYIPQQQGANITTNAYQVPNAIYNYPVTSCYAQPAAGKSQFNGVNIEIINPQGQGVPQGALTMPANFVPVNNIPAYQPVPQPMVPQQPMIQQFSPQPMVQEQPVVQQFPQQPMVQQTPPPVVPAPQINTAEPVVTPTIETPATAIDPNFTPEAFAGRLATEDIKAQKAAIDELAETVKNNDQVAPLLLDTIVVDALNNIVNKDTSALEGPTPEVLELRNKPETELTPEQATKAATLSPLEEAEFNKQFALYTLAFMQERLNNEVTQKGGEVIALKDLPSIETVINGVKSNPNPNVRLSALAALSYIAKPEYKQDLATIFELAKADEDANVQQEATTALENLNKLPDAAAPVAQ